MARIEMRPSRTAGLALLVFLLGILTGRLILEPSGTGLLIFLLTLPFTLALLIALFGVGAGIFLEALFAGTAFLVYAVVRFSAAGWVTLVLVPAAAVAIYIMIQTLRAIWPVRAAREGKEEE